jgi:hypothetical protein
MPEKAFTDFEYVDDELEKAILHATGGVEPDNFVESSFGAAVTGPPDPKTEPEERKLMEDLDKQLKKKINNQSENGDGLIYDATE